MSDRLFPFVSRMMARPFVWGACDCVTVPADWVQLLTGRDPAAGLRLTYSSPAECQRVTGFFTDPVGVIGPRLRACGLVEAVRPRRGDVGVVVLGPDERPHGAICLDGKVWAMKGPSGMAAQVPTAVLQAWTLPKGGNQ